MTPSRSERARPLLARSTVTTTEAGVAGNTVTATVPVLPSLVAVTVAVPVATAVIIPLVLTVAMLLANTLLAAELRLGTARG